MSSTRRGLFGKALTDDQREKLEGIGCTVEITGDAECAVTAPKENWEAVRAIVSGKDEPIALDLPLKEESEPRPNVYQEPDVDLAEPASDLDTGECDG